MKTSTTPLAHLAFDLFFLPFMRHRLGGPYLAGCPRGLATDLPLLLVSNHVSWWDGFLLRELQRIVRPGAPGYTIMRRDELRRLPYFRLIGCLGIDPASPASLLGVMRFLRRTRVARPDMMVSFFPQGEIWPSFRRPLGFQRGVDRFAAAMAPVAVLPVAMHLESLNRSAPTAFISAGPPLRSDEHALTSDLLEAAVTRQSAAILAFLAEHGEAAPRRWPGPAGRLPGAD